MRQHELAEAAEKSEAQLQILIGAREEVAKKLAAQARLLDLSNDAIIVRDRANNITFWNKGAEAFYGWSKDEALGKNLHPFLQTVFAVPFEEILVKLQRDGNFSGEVVQVARDGRRIPSLCRWVLDREEGSILTSHTDITARKAAELEMARVRDSAVAASQAKDSFLAALSHELRTPLNPVLLIASDEVSDPRLSASVRDSFGIIVKNVLLEARLIDDLLDLTKINHGKMPLELSCIEVNTVARDALKTVAKELQEKNLVLSVGLESAPCLVSGDAGRLQQVFGNILANAIKFTPSGGKIDFSTRFLNETAEVEITLRDSGLGMTASELGRIFVAFSQGDHVESGDRQTFGGLGLGLAIARKIVRLHSGRIIATSPGRGLGSCFQIVLPGVRAESPRTSVLSSISPASTGTSLDPFVGTLRKQRILLVEDHDETRLSLQRLLLRRGHSVVTAGSKVEAVDLARVQTFDVVISDIGLPDGDGCELMTELRDKYAIKGIALSGYGMEQDILRGQKAGFVAYLTKPISMQSLEKAIADVANAG